jgi:branched-chain amino acid transport system substrate-binding protein
MHIRLVSSLTRSGSSMGQSDAVVNAMRLRMEEADNRLLGMPIVYDDLDGGSEETGSWDAERERANARYAVADPDVLAYVATLDADAAPHSIPITNRAGLLQISPCNTYPGLTRPFDPGEPDRYYPTGKRNYLRTALSDDLQGSFAAHWAKELGAEAAVVLHDTEPFGRGVALPFADRCRELGIDVVGEPIGIVPKQEEYAELAERVAASGADLVFYGGIIQNGAGPLWRDIRTAAPKAAMMGSDALFEEAFIADAGEHAEGTYITFGSVPPALLEGPGKAFFHRYVERFGKEPESYAASSYDAMGVVLEAIERVGAPDRAGVVEAAFGTRNFPGLQGRFSFDANGDADLRRGTRLTVRGGRFQPLRVLEIEG